jgi:hypothetical protein
MTDLAADFDELLCPLCGYNLRGIQSDRCPECGLHIDREALSLSIIPWTFRRKIEPLRAFAKTVHLAMRHPQRLGYAASRPVDFHDAQKFRWLVVLLAWLPLCATALVIRAVMKNAPNIGVALTVGWPMRPITPGDDLFLCEVIGATSWLVPSIALLLLIASLSGVGSYFFHPRSLRIAAQNRAIALSCYVCAPLSFLIIPCLLLDAAALMLFLDKTSTLLQYRLLVAFSAGGIGSLAIILLWQWHVTLVLLKSATQCTTARLITAAIGLPILWFVLLILTLGVFPLLCGFARLMLFNGMEF